MAKTTVSKELAALYPSLEGKVGQTVDQSEIAAARANKRADDKAAKKNGSAPASATAPSAPVAPKKKATARKASPRKSTSKRK